MLFDVSLFLGNNFSSIVKLNIGGKKFMTSKSTLYSKGENLITRLVENSQKQSIFDVVKDEKGYIFIDRNGYYFEIILDYLRTLQWDIPRNITFSIIKRELDFYCISYDDDEFIIDQPLQTISQYEFNLLISSSSNHVSHVSHLNLQRIFLDDRDKNIVFHFCDFSFVKCKQYNLEYHGNSYFNFHNCFFYKSDFDLFHKNLLFADCTMKHTNINNTIGSYYTKFENCEIKESDIRIRGCKILNKYESKIIKSKVIDSIFEVDSAKLNKEGTEFTNTTISIIKLD
eukprot:TRINITY_DN489_c0_g2_i2.p1 TRINITY_DN489_c0_g2~~TRINITY_DN489_c0_g2_i2.p1  ORF type:complete len:285 (-),score=36.95 TRINITY_DN489_c0_g2_i2:64-918(-)